MGLRPLCTPNFNKTMNSDKKNPFDTIVYLCLFLIVIVLVSWFISTREGQQFALIEQRRLARFSLDGLGLKSILVETAGGNFATAASLVNRVVFERDFQIAVERAASDQFPLRMSMINLSKTIDRAVIRLAYAFLPDPAIPADKHSGFFILRDESAIIYMPNRFDESEKQKIDNRIKNYEEIIIAYPDINFYLFHIERNQYAPYNPLNPFFPESDAGQGLAYFLAHKPEGLHFANLTMTDLDDYFNKFYNTDHHYNVHGMLLAYEGIHELLSKNYPEITPKIEFGEIIGIPEIDFLGYTARETFFPIHPNGFEIVELNLTQHRLYIEGQEVVQNEHLQYLQGIFSTEPYTDHYGLFFGGSSQFSEYIFENGSNRNLLILSDSFKNPIQAWIASHYHHTYAINPTRFGKLSLSQFLQDYAVDDILVLGGNNVIFSDDFFRIEP